MVELIGIITFVLRAEEDVEDVMAEEEAAGAALEDCTVSEVLISVAVLLLLLFLRFFLVRAADAVE